MFELIYFLDGKLDSCQKTLKCKSLILNYWVYGGLSQMWSDTLIF